MYVSRRVLIIFHSDIDECERGTDGCDHNCTNTDGSYYCTCMDGYELESDNHTCTGNVYVHACVIHMHLSTLYSYSVAKKLITIYYVCEYTVLTHAYIDVCT